MLWKVVKTLLKEKRILPGMTIGIVGGGQLGKMMAQSAKQMGFLVGILEPSFPSPAGEVADFQITASYHDEAALRQLAEKCDVLTFEFENVDVKTLEAVAELTYFPQGTKLLYLSQNRLREKNYLHSLGIPLPKFAPIDSFADLEKATEKMGFPCVLKTVEGGYDGKGQMVLKNLTDLETAKDLAENAPCVLEEWIPFDLEISIMVVRNSQGDLAVFPVSENIHRHNILHVSLVPARIPEKISQQATDIALKIAEDIQLVGCLAVEMFVGKNGEIYANELAPRPHNSGHYSIELCNDSQFSAHIKSICNWPLAPITLLSSGLMVNILGEDQEKALGLIFEKPHYHFHFYGKKEARPGRKMGHITLFSNNLEKSLAELAATKVWD